MSDAVMIGVEACGCITYANARPDLIDAEDLRAINALRKRGGHTEMTTVAEARANPDFLPVECPHDPKGWSR